MSEANQQDRWVSCAVCRHRDLKHCMLYNKQINSACGCAVCSGCMGSGVTFSGDPCCRCGGSGMLVRANAGAQTPGEAR